MEITDIKDKEMGLFLKEKEIECFSENKEIEYFFSVNKRITTLFENEKIDLSEEFFRMLFTFLSGACTYEEEGVKIKPNILLGFNIDNILEFASSSFKITMFKDDFNGTNFSKKIKALIPFCKNDWIIFIDIKNEKIEYGIFRSYSGPKGLTLNQIIFESERYSNEMNNSGIISIEIINKHEIQIRGLRGNKLLIDFSLIENESQNIEQYMDKLAYDVTSNNSISENDKNDLRKIFKKIFKVAYKKLHGAICLVVKADYKFPNEILSDGIWLEEPINLSEIAIEFASNTSDNLLTEMYYSLTGVLIEMLNIDGITIIDDRGYIRGYNVFITKSNTDGNKVVGGARKRAFNSLIESNDQMCIGAYFQSQDGYISYERVKHNE